VNALGIDREILRYATGWETAYASRILIGLLGVLILSGTARAVWKKDCAALTAVLWLILGSIFLAFSIVPQRLITFVVSTDYVTRIRFIVGGLSILVLLITLESIRRTVLMERYALLWIVTALAILFCALFPEAVALFRAVTGMEYEFMDRRSMEGSERSTVYSFLIVPEVKTRTGRLTKGGIVRNMKEVAAAAEDYEQRYYGVAQFQMKMLSEIPVGERDRIFIAFLSQNPEILRRLMRPGGTP
jgi:hypothetical protein